MRHHDEDLIDFPVSDLYRDHYAAQGMTYPSGRYPKRETGGRDRDQEIKELTSIIQTLRDQLAEIHLTQTYPHLNATEDSPPSKPAKTFEE